MATTTTAALVPDLFPERIPITPAQVAAGVAAALTVQRRAVTFGKRPFAAVLLGPDNETVLLTHQSLDQVNHAESSLARLAYTHYSKEFLWRCTLVSTWEPCGMCTATIYVCLLLSLFFFLLFSRPVSRLAAPHLFFFSAPSHLKR
jgi:tRNA(Arg) A34 adenosine deaminase TadA